MPPRTKNTQNTTGNQIRYDSLHDEDQMEGEQQTEEPLEIEMAQKPSKKKGLVIGIQIKKL